MNIHTNFYVRQAALFLQERILSPFIEQNKKILIIITAALALLAVCYLIKRYWNNVQPLPAAVKRSDPLSPEAIDILKKNANAYATAYNDHSPFMTRENQSEALRAYIHGIIDNPEFQKDSTAYMAAWIQKRGDSESNHFPEDDAMDFFQEELKLKHLVYISELD